MTRHWMSDDCIITTSQYKQAQHSNLELVTDVDGMLKIGCLLR